MDASIAMNISSLLPNTTNSSQNLTKNRNIPHVDREWLRLLRVVIMSITMLVALFGNSLVIACICYIKEMRTITGVFLVNLAVSDLGVAFFCLPVAIAASWNRALLENQVYCNLDGFSLVFFFLASIQTLAAISVHKYIAVVHAMSTKMTKKHACIVIAAIWVVSLLLATGPIIGWSKYVHIPGRHQCSTSKPISVGDYSHMSLLLSIGYIIPVITMTFCYSRLYCTSRKHMKRLRANAIISDTEGTSERDLINTLVIILFGFIICWLPFVVYISFGLQKVPIPPFLPTIAFLFGYGNSAMNPIVYGLRHKYFRKGFYELLTICCNSEARHKYAATTTTLICRESPAARPREIVNRKEMYGFSKNGIEVNSLHLLGNCCDDIESDDRARNIINEDDA